MTPVRNADGYDSDYLEFIALFNEGQYEACNSSLIGLWQRNPTNKFYKGLIQMSGAYHHWETESLFWAEDMFASAHNMLAQYAPRYQGLDITSLLRDLQQCNRVAQIARERGGKEMAEVSMPRIQLRLSSEALH